MKSLGHHGTSCKLVFSVHFMVTHDARASEIKMSFVCARL